MKRRYYLIPQESVLDARLRAFMVEAGESERDVRKIQRLRFRCRACGHYFAEGSKDQAEFFAKLAESIYGHNDALLYFLKTNVLRRTLNEIYIIYGKK